MDQSFSSHLFPASPGTAQSGACGSAAPPSCDEGPVVAAHLDAAFYLARYGDVRDAGLDPARHYCETGWREGRDPADWFETLHYLRAYPDIRAAGVNPFWHYLVQGHREARLPAPPGWRWRRELAALPLGPQPHSVPPPPDLDTAALAALLAGATAGRRGLVLALSHDRYTDNPGGTQLLIADEQRKFNGDGVAYLHLSPTVPRLGLAPAAGAVTGAVVLDGRMRGVADPAGLAEALAALTLPEARLLAVHNLHGHRPEDAAALARAFRPRKAVFWAHDYGAGCPSPRLLRNDIEFCGAPPPDSMACRVCAHGADRAAHLDRMQALFAAVPFVLAAPSDTARHWWQRSAGLTLAGALVHPHVTLAPSPAPPVPRAVPRAGPVRVAFAGHAAHHKGWGVFRDLAVAARDGGEYRFFHLASPAELRPHDGVEAVAAAASAHAPFGMAQALAAQRIDLVLALSPWPETFGYVPHEALAAGADVVTTQASGHVAALLRGLGRGVVLDDAAALLDWFLSGRAVRHAATLRETPPPALAATHAGSTATLGGGAAITPEPDPHLLAGGARLDGTRDGWRWRFELPRAARGPVRLRSRHCQPVWEQMDGADLRRLGVAVVSLTLDGQDVAPDDARRGSGWHAPEAGWTWTGGDAEIHCGDSAVLDITLLPLARYWRATGLDA